MLIDNLKRFVRVGLSWYLTVLLLFYQLGEELWFAVGGQHIPFDASPQVR